MPILDPLTRQIIGFCYRVSNILGHCEGRLIGTTLPGPSPYGRGDTCG
jgi:hypothetical protein